MSTMPVGEYRFLWSQGLWHVAWVAKDEPFWWRWVATFSSRARAEEFAEVQNDIRDDEDIRNGHAFEEVEIPPREIDPVGPTPEPAERSETAGFMRARSSTVERPTLTRKAEDSNPFAPASDAPLTEDEAEYLDDMEALGDADTSPPPAAPVDKPRPGHERPAGLTPGEYRCWLAIAKAISETGVTPDRATLADDLVSTRATISVFIHKLVKTGYLHRDGRSGIAPIIQVLKWPEGVVPRETEIPVPAENKKPARVRDGTYATRTPEGEPKAARRFTVMPELDPGSVRGLSEDHPAVTEGRTLFPTTVVDAADSPRLLVSGQNSRKLGSHVTKGPWKGFPIYSLTLEERATCPDSCHLFSSCYGNSMPFARRHRHGPDLELKLYGEVADLAELHPRGFVVRLHQLGDFYSLDYVMRWSHMLKDFPALRCFGYTAWPRHSPIGQTVKMLTDKQWDRFAIRFSSAEPKPQGATSIDYVPDGPRVPEGIVCPAQMKRTDSCGSCGLCWHAAARDKTIVFVLHGPKFEGRKPAAAPEPAAPAVTVLPPAVQPKPRAVKAKGAYAPKKPAYQRAIVPTIAPNIVDEAAEANLDVAFPAPKQRRCPRCNQVFGCRNLNEVICPTCAGAHARTPASQQPQGEQP